MQHGPLLQRGAQGPVQAIFEVELAAPADHMREQVAVESGVGRQDSVQVEHVLGGDELVEPDWARWYLSPLASAPGVVRIGPPVPDLLENHNVSLDERATWRRCCGLHPGSGHRVELLRGIDKLAGGGFA